MDKENKDRTNNESSDNRPDGVWEDDPENLPDVDIAISGAPEVRKPRGVKDVLKRLGPIRLGWRTRLLFFILPILAVPLIALAIVYAYFTEDMPSIENLKHYRPPTVTFIYSDDGRLIGEYWVEHRLVVPLSKIPQHVIAAFIAAEDANFFNHPGLDLLGIARAFAKNMEAGRIVQGGSTITQQVVRSFLLSNERTYERKLREIILSYRIEQNLTKGEILYLYLNQIYLGRGAYGVESAAQAYFGKHVNELTLAEAAFLAGLVQAPSRYSPFRSPNAAWERQRYVLDQMLQSEFITLQQAEVAMQERMVFKRMPNITESVTPQFTEYVRRVAEDMFGPDRLYSEGFQIHTTVNIEAELLARDAVKRGMEDYGQRHGYRGPRKNLAPHEWDSYLAEAAGKPAYRDPQPNVSLEGLVVDVSNKNRTEVKAGKYRGYVDAKGMAFVKQSRRGASALQPGDVVLLNVEEIEPSGLIRFSVEQDPDVQAGLVCMEAETGQVKAMIGAKDYYESKFNRAVQAQRQPGSSFKPFVYTAAMDSGFTPASIVVDYPVEYEDQGKVWKPQNYGRGHRGSISLYQALINSVNVVAVRLLEKVGAERVIEYAHRMGIQSPLGPNLSLALGTSEVNLLEMVSAYSTFPNLGKYAEPMFITRIDDRNGRAMQFFDPRLHEAISPETAYVMVEMMRGVVTSGTARRVSALGRPVAGKTGTTQDHADAWFVGYTPGYSAGVWIGKDVRESMGSSEQGGRTAGPIFLDFMKNFLEDKPVRDFRIPPGVIRQPISTRMAEEDGELREQTIYMTFKADQVGPGELSENFIWSEEDTKEVEDKFMAQDEVSERMKKHVEQYKSRLRISSKPGSDRQL